MKKIYLLIIFLILAISIYSQGIEVAFQTGLSNFKMSDLKELNQRVYLPFDTELVSDFPAYYYYQPSAYLTFKKINVGISYSFHSTGSRISRKDYSGEYFFDTKVKSDSYSLNIEYNTTQKENLNFFIYSEFGKISSLLTIKEYFDLYDENYIDNKFIYKSKNYYFEPGFKIIYPIREVKFALNLGYLIQFGKNSFRLIEDSRVDLSIPYINKSVKPGWSGIRIGISVHFQLAKSSEIFNLNRF